MNIYVGNLAYGVTEEDIQELFAEHGEVTKVNLIVDRETGNSKGFAFVEMAIQFEREKAIKELNEKPLKGRNLKVNQAKPKEDRSRARRRR